MSPDFTPAGWVPRTKLVRPSPAPDAVVDPALIARVHRGIRTVGLTMIVAQAGAGKTTLASVAAQTLDHPSGWIRLDDLDDDPAVLFELLVLALSPLVPGGLPAAQQLLDTGLPASTDPRRAVGVLVNELAGAGPLLLVLDDLHVVRSPRAVSVLGYLVAHLPTELRILATARHDPALPLARLRAVNELVELRDGDLRLSVRQAQELLNVHLGLGLSPERVAQVVETSAGWVTGVRLLGRSPDAVDDYLADELLGNEAPDVERFLLDTAVLDDLVPVVCAAVTGRPDAGRVLDDLARRHGLLVLRTGDTGFRYHGLLRTTLRRLLGHDPPRVLALHRAAAAAVGEPAARVEHLLAATAWAEAGDAIEALAGPGLPRPADLHRIAGWIRRMPGPAVAGRPRLGLLDGYEAVHRGDLAAAAATLEPVLASVTANGDVPATLLAVRALHLATYDHARFEPAFVELEAAAGFAALPAVARADHHLARTYAAVHTGRWDAAADRLARVFDAADGSGDAATSEVLAQHLSPLLVPAAGALDRIEAHAAQAEHRFGNTSILIALGAGHQRAFTALLRGRFDDALCAARTAGDGPERLGGLPFIRASLDWVTAGIAYARGDLAAAEPVLRVGMDPAGATDLDRDLGRLRTALMARVLRRQGRRAELAELAALTRPAGARQSGPAACAAASVRAQSAWADGDLDGAATILREALPLAARAPLVPFVVAIRIDLALVLDAAGRRPDALAAFRGAVEEARAWGAPGVPALAGDEARALLVATGGRTAAAALAALDTAPAPAPLAVPGRADVLTGREVEVLRLLAGGASNRDIAARLVVSENTVKTHVRHVLAKLGAGSRGEAVARAHRHHLV